MTQVETDLKALLSALSMLSTACLANGDLNDNFRVMGAMSQVSAALSLAGANDIIAMLPNDADGAKISAMLSHMGAVAAGINADISKVTKTVQFATGVANIVADVVKGDIPSAVGVVSSLGG